MAISYANNDWLSTLSAVNGASPKPDYDAVDIGRSGGTGTGLFGLTPDDISGRFDDSFDTAVGKYDPFPGNRSKIDQLQDLYGTVGDAYDVSDTLTALGSTRKANLLGGEQAANTVARKFEESSIPGSASGVGASMLRAQALLPYLQADTAAAAEEGKYKDSAKQNALGAAADIATKLAQLEQDYTNSLAAYNTNKANFGVNYAGQSSDLALKSSQANTANNLDWMKTQAQIAENARQANLQAALHTQDANTQAQQTANAQTMQAANSVLSQKAPTGSWTTDANGKIISGNADYDAYQTYLRNRAAATQSISTRA